MTTRTAADTAARTETDDDLLTPQEVAKKLRIAVSTLEQWRGHKYLMFLLRLSQPQSILQPLNNRCVSIMKNDSQFTKAPNILAPVIYLVAVCFAISVAIGVALGFLQT